MDLSELFKDADELLGIKAAPPLPPPTPEPIIKEKKHWKLPSVTPIVTKVAPLMAGLIADIVVVYLSFKIQASALILLILGMLFFWQTMTAIFTAMGANLWQESIGTIVYAIAASALIIGVVSIIASVLGLWFFWIIMPMVIVDCFMEEG